MAGGAVSYDLGCGTAISLPLAVGVDIELLGISAEVNLAFGWGGWEAGGAGEFETGAGAGDEVAIGVNAAENRTGTALELSQVGGLGWGAGGAEALDDEATVPRRCGSYGRLGASCGSN